MPWAVALWGSEESDGVFILLLHDSEPDFKAQSHCATMMSSYSVLLSFQTSNSEY